MINIFNVIHVNTKPCVNNKTLKISTLDNFTMLLKWNNNAIFSIFI